MTARPLHNDEPTSVDQLHRGQLADALARLTLDCETPLVIGLYGGWGTGKTSLMKLIQKRLDPVKTRHIWFDAWQHQQDESPAIALLHTMIEDLELADESKKLLSAIALGLGFGIGSALLKKFTADYISIKELKDIGERIEEEQFKVRSAQVRLQKHFRSLIEKAREPDGRRIVFFIDDLDRCSPGNMLRMLDALKLYLNLPGCLYFVAVDREALEHGIKEERREGSKQEGSYLDKIVQLPFTIPPISSRSLMGFVEALLPPDLQSCGTLLVNSLGGNAREIKRFINMFIFSHYLAEGLKLFDYEPSVLALMLLIQHRSPDLFALMVKRPSLLHLVRREALEAKPVIDQYLRGNESLFSAIKTTVIPSSSPLENYISLTSQITEQREIDVAVPPLELRTVLRGHSMWIRTRGKSGQKADLRGMAYSKADFGSANLRDADLAGANLYCADFTRADLRRAVFRATNLEGAILRFGNLRGANFNEARLKNADLSFADLAGADLAETNLKGANLHGAIGLTRKQLERSLVNQDTKLPLYLT